MEKKIKSSGDWSSIFIGILLLMFIIIYKAELEIGIKIGLLMFITNFIIFFLMSIINKKNKHIFFDETKIIIYENEVDFIEIQKKDIENIRRVKNVLKINKESKYYMGEHCYNYFEINLKNGSNIEYDYNCYKNSDIKIILENLEKMGFDMEEKLKIDFFEEN